MADVNGARSSTVRRSIDRGQLFLVTGLAIAVVLVALVLLLNAAIYTENLATRSVGSDAGPAIEFRSEAVAQVGGLVDAENAGSHPDPSAVADAVDAGVEEIHVQTYNRSVQRGVATEITLVDTTPGQYLAQDATQRFTHNGSADGDGNWTLVEDASATRGFVLRIDNGSLPDADASNVTDAALGVNVSGFDDGGNFTETYVYADTADGGNVSVDVRENPSGSLETACELSAADVGSNVTLDITDGRLEGTHCGRLWPANVSAYDRAHNITVRNGDAAAGTYELTVGDGSVTTGATHLAPDPAVYSADVRIRYESAELDFETTGRVARGEPNA